MRHVFTKSTSVYSVTSQLICFTNALKNESGVGFKFSRALYYIRHILVTIVVAHPN